MTRFVFYTATTLDGYLADEHDSLDWLFKQEAASADGAETRADDEGSHGDYEQFITGIGALAMGRTTYDWVGRHLAESGEAWPYQQPSWVFTHHPDDVERRPGVTVVSGPPADHAAALREAAGEKDVWVVGGGDLAAQFAEAGMLDELQLSIAPVTLGAGRPLFPRRYDLRLARLTRNGPFAVATYDVVGPLD